MNNPPIDPKLQDIGVDLSHAHELVSEDQTDAIEATYFRDLVEVATDAAEGNRRSYDQTSGQSLTEGTAAGPASTGSGKRKHTSSDRGHESEEQHGRANGQTKKRRKHPVNNDAKPASDRPAPEDHESSFSSDPSAARLAAAQPGPAIFRAPSGKKSTRPAVAKEFRNLELCPESFHKMQAYAKKYMLDPEYPERKTYVGNRGQTDNAQIRHDLQKCVREFLEEGPGEEFFGADSADPNGDGERSGGNSRSFSWPADKELIIQLCSPLLRRMIVNERQREYALKTRRGPKTQDDSDKQTMTPSIQIYLVDQSGKRKLCDRFDLHNSSELSWATIQESIHRQAARLLTDGRSQTNTNSATPFRVLTANGLEDVPDDQTWQRILQQFMEVEWLEGTVKVIVPMRGFT
ncbi:hypothetical protein MBLNU457_3598t1 [Dothideomycetes sp. NU457]